MDLLGAVEGHSQLVELAMTLKNVFVVTLGTEGSSWTFTKQSGFLNAENPVHSALTRVVALPESTVHIPTESELVRHRSLGYRFEGLTHALLLAFRNVRLHGLGPCRLWLPTRVGEVLPR